MLLEMEQEANRCRVYIGVLAFIIVTHINNYKTKYIVEVSYFSRKRFIKMEIDVDILF